MDCVPWYLLGKWSYKHKGGVRLFRALSHLSFIQILNEHLQYIIKHTRFYMWEMQTRKHSQRGDRQEVVSIRAEQGPGSRKRQPLPPHGPQATLPHSPALILSAPSHLQTPASTLLSAWDATPQPLCQVNSNSFPTQMLFPQKASLLLQARCGSLVKVLTPSWTSLTHKTLVIYRITAPHLSLLQS